MSEESDPIADLRRTLAAARRPPHTPPPQGGGVVADDEIALTEDTSAPAVPPSPNAVVVSRYDRWRAGEVLEGSDVLSEKLNLGTNRQAAVEDFHTVAYSPAVKLEPRCEDELRGGFVRTLLETPEYVALRARTACNAIESDMATHHFAREFAALVKKQEEKEKERRKRKKTTPQQKEADAAEDDMDFATAAGQAVKQAQEEIQQFGDAGRAFGVIGDGPGTGNDPRRALKLFRQVSGSPLQRILELAGRYRNVARAKQQTRPNHGNDIFASFETGNNIPRLLPHELAWLVAPGDVGTLQCAKFLERSLFQRSFRTVRKEAKGPIIVGLDESGSMGSLVPGGGGATYLDYGKAFALAMMWIARQQKRWIAVVGWSSHGQINPLIIPPTGIQDDQAMINWLGHFYGGSTCVPLLEMADIYKMTGAPDGKTDVIMVTDDVCSIVPATATSFKAWKKEKKVKMITIALTFGSGGATGAGLRDVSDDFFRVGELNANGAAVGQAFSI